ncbi:hypothetical protein PVPAM_120013300 [Plasmodium vivax]|nr:hypothetical protein PVPAM_120013300 [Plasmodium vivax]
MTTFRQKGERKRQSRRNGTKRDETERNEAKHGKPNQTHAKHGPTRQEFHNVCPVPPAPLHGRKQLTPPYSRKWLK